MVQIDRLPEKVNLLATVQPWIDRGFTEDLLLVIPPGAPLSPYSNLTTAHCGKTPGLPTPDGWVGHRGWTRENVSRETLKQRLATLAGAPFSLGLQARRFHAFDVDTDDLEFARRVYHHLKPIIDRCGLGIRVGKAPGFLVPFRLMEPRHKARISFVHEILGSGSAVEMLGQGQQYVIQGKHPKTGQPYRWYPLDKPPEFLAP